MDKEFVISCIFFIILFIVAPFLLWWFNREGGSNGLNEGDGYDGSSDGSSDGSRGNFEGGSNGGKRSYGSSGTWNGLPTITVRGIEGVKPRGSAYSYSELLSDERWGAVRSRIIERDGGCCKWCGRGFGLVVHHRYYLQYPNGNKVNPWEYKDEALMTLCRECHEWYHSKNRVKVYYRRYGNG